MRALFLGALLLAGLASQAKAQLAVGPITIVNDVNGVRVAISATSWITVNSAGNETVVDTRILADLADLQKKFSHVVNTLAPPVDGCANRGVDNQSSVVSLKSGALWPRDDQLIMLLRGQIDVWSCVPASSKSGILWKRKKIGFIKLNVPHFHTWTKNSMKSKRGTQLFRGGFPINLVKKDNATFTLKITKPNLMLEGEKMSLTDANLQLAIRNINQGAFNTIQSAINPASLKKVLPEELQKLNMTVISARFRDYGGHAIAEIILAARVPEGSIPQLLQQAVLTPPNRIGNASSVLNSLR